MTNPSEDSAAKKLVKCNGRPQVQDYAELVNSGRAFIKARILRGQEHSQKSFANNGTHVRRIRRALLKLDTTWNRLIDEVTAEIEGRILPQKPAAKGRNEGIVGAIRALLRKGPYLESMNHFKGNIDQVIAQYTDLPSKEQAFLVLLDELAKERFNDYQVDEGASHRVDTVIALGCAAFQRYKKSRSQP